MPSPTPTPAPRTLDRKNGSNACARLLGRQVAAVVGDLDDHRRRRAPRRRRRCGCSSMRRCRRSPSSRTASSRARPGRCAPRRRRSGRPGRSAGSRARAARASARRGAARRTPRRRDRSSASSQRVASVCSARTLLAMRSAPVVMSSRQRSAVACGCSARFATTCLRSERRLSSTRRQRVVRLVREPGGERADERDPIRLEQRQLRLRRDADVAHDEHDADRSFASCDAPERELGAHGVAVLVDELQLDDRRRRLAGARCARTAARRAVAMRGRDRAVHRRRRATPRACSRAGAPPGRSRRSLELAVAIPRARRRRLPAVVSASSSAGISGAELAHRSSRTCPLAILHHARELQHLVVHRDVDARRERAAPRAAPRSGSAAHRSSAARTAASRR